MNLKVGDILIAKNGCKMIHSKKNALIIGKEYPITKVSDISIFIDSESGKFHEFPLCDDQEGHNVEYFFDVKPNEFHEKTKMDNEQLNSNLNELIKNQIEICEKLDKLGKRIKKIGKPKKSKKEYNGPCSIDLEYIKQQVFSDCGMLHALANSSLLKAEPNQDQKYYLCIKDYSNIKEGTVLKFREFDKLTNCNLYTYKAVCGFPESALFVDISNEPNFIPIQQFETLKEGQEIEFTLRNGKTYKTLVKKDSCDKYTLSLWHQLGNCPYQELNQIEFKTNLLKEYGNSWWLTTNNLEDLTKELNKLITLPDLSKESKHIKTDQNESLLVQANELIDKFMPLVNGWDKNQPKHNECYQGAINEPVIGLWYYSQQNQRKAAIKCAIVHCELWIEVAFGHAADEALLIKSQLQKMLSE